MIETVLLKIKIYNLEENFLRIKAKIKKDLLVTNLTKKILSFEDEFLSDTNKKTVYFIFFNSI